MAPFKFVETFFFISLAISFLLILLLVYHFKQRLGSLEQKSDNMFEIVNNIVKELNILRNTKINQFSGFPTGSPSNCFGPSCFPPQAPSATKNIPMSDNNIFVSLVDDRLPTSRPTPVEEPVKKEDKKEDEDDDYEDDYDEDDDDEDEDDEDDDDEDDEDDDEDDKPDEIVVENLDNIKIIQLEDTTVDLEITNIEEERENIPVEKVDETATPSNNVVGSGEYTKDVIRKMTVQELKNLVTNKGLCSDASKMKKPELIKLLENILE